MIKTIVTGVAALALLAAPAFAKTLQLPNEEFAIATIDVPDSWGPEEVTNGFEATSSDKAVYLAVVAVGNGKGMDAELDDTFAMLKEQHVDLDKSTKSEDKFKVNGMEATEITYQGKDEDGPAAVSIAFVPMKDKVVVFTYWVSTDKEKENQPAVAKILNSLKAAE